MSTESSTTFLKPKLMSFDVFGTLMSVATLLLASIKFYRTPMRCISM